MSRVSRRLLTVLIALSCALTAASCDEEGSNNNEDMLDGMDGTDGTDGTDDADMTPDQTPDMDMADPCEGLTLCPTEGSECDGDSVVTCAPNADGCLVETTTACDAGQVCDDTGATAQCVDEPDPCEGVSNCDTEGRSCDGTSLVICAPDMQGCLVEQTMDCGAAISGGFCDDSGAMPVCGVDACAGVANACDTEGTSCDAGELVTCEPDAFGCLVETRTDCTTATNGACDDTGAEAICTGDVDCASLPDACDTEGTSCVGPELVTCEPDAFGCLVASTTDCTAVTNGFCDAGATPAQCDVSFEDPCEGVDQCTPEGRTCDADTLTVCAPDAFGCLIEATEDCTANGEICDDTGAMAVCRPPCTDECVDGTVVCSGNELQSCFDSDADGCTELNVTDCSATSQLCDETAGACVDNGSGDTCGDTYVVFPGSGQLTGADFFADFTDSVSVRNATGCTNTSSADASAELILEVPLGAGDEFRITEHGSIDVVINITSTCASGSSCLAGKDFGETNPMIYTATTDETIFVVVEAYYDSDPGYEAYDIRFEVIPVVCGDAIVTPNEACDDGNTSDGDGCSADCQTVEAGFDCVPGFCYAEGAGDVCATPIALAGNTTLVFDSTSFTNDYTAYTGACTGTAAAGNDVVFSVELADGEALEASAYFDTGDELVLALATDCADLTGSCIESDIDDSLSSTEYLNDTGATQTVFLIVDGSLATDMGEFALDLSVATPVCGNNTLEPTEGCDDGNTDPGDGCSATCEVEGDTCMAGEVIAATAGTYTGDTSAANLNDDYDDDYDPSCPGNVYLASGDGNDVAYVVTLAAGETLTVDMTATAADMGVYLISAASNECTLINNATCLDGEDLGGVGDTETVTYTSTLGENIYIIVDGYAGGEGPYTLTITIN